MKKAAFVLALLLAGMASSFAGLKPGDKVNPFSLKASNGEMVSLSDFTTQKGLIVIFSSNTCPFSLAYEERIMDLHKRFSNEGFPLIMINPNQAKNSPADGLSRMQARAKEKGFRFPYLKDEDQLVCKAFGALKTPQVFLLENKNGTFRLAYCGAIDNNAMDANRVSSRYLEQAIIALVKGKKPNPAVTKAIGCNIR